jgi:hypothetical protein
MTLGYEWSSYFLIWAATCNKCVAGGGVAGGAASASARTSIWSLLQLLVLLAGIVLLVMLVYAVQSVGSKVSMRLEALEMALGQVSTVMAEAISNAGGAREGAARICDSVTGL